MPLNPFFIFFIGTIIFIITYVIGFPEESWFNANVPLWVAILNIIYFDIHCIIFFTNLKERLNKTQFNILIVGFFISVVFIKVSALRVPILVWVSVISLGIIYIIWGVKAQKGDKDQKDGSN